jgi:hypothetical protein
MWKNIFIVVVIRNASAINLNVVYWRDKGMKVEHIVYKIRHANLNIYKTTNNNQKKKSSQDTNFYKN